MNKYWQKIHAEYASLKHLWLEWSAYEGNDNGDPLYAAYMAYYDIRKQVELDRHVQEELSDE